MKERLQELGNLMLEKKPLWSDMIATHQYLKGCHAEDGAITFSVMLDDRAWTNGRTWTNGYSYRNGGCIEM